MRPLNRPGVIAGKRSQGRLPVRLTAKLLTVSTHHDGVLENISRRGARLTLPQPPRRGSDVVLRWDGHEAFGTVTWVSGGRCGLSFCSPVPEAMLLATRSLDEAARAAGDTGDGNRSSARAWVEGSARLGLD